MKIVLLLTLFATTTNIPNPTFLRHLNSLSMYQKCQEDVLFCVFTILYHIGMLKYVKKVRFHLGPLYDTYHARWN